MKSGYSALEDRWKVSTSFAGDKCHCIAAGNRRLGSWRVRNFDDRSLEDERLLEREVC